MISEIKNSNFFFVKTLYLLLMILIPTVLSGAPKANALTVVSNVDDAILLAEMYPNIAFQSFGFHSVNNVSRTNTSSEVTADTIRFSSNFLFSIDNTSFSGPGTWESTETQNSFSIDLQYNLGVGNSELIFHYTCQEDLVEGSKSESVEASFESSTLFIQKQTDVTPTTTGKIINNSGTVNINGQESQFSVEITENQLSSNTSIYGIINETTPINPSGPTKLLEIEYEVVSNPDGSMTATYSKYDVKVGGQLRFKLDDASPSTHQLIIEGANSATENLLMNLIDVKEGNKKRRCTIANTININNIAVAMSSLKSSEEGGWSWNDFGKTTFVGTAGGAAGAAAGYGVALLCANPPGLLAAALIGATAGGVGGAAGYGASELWDAVFQGDSPPQTVRAATYAENNKRDLCHSAHGGYSSSVPTLSEWKQIFLTLLMLSLVMGFTRQQNNNLGIAGGGTLNGGHSTSWLVFDRRIFYNVMRWVGATVVVSLAGATVIFGHFSFLDITGTIFCAPLLAYILHLVVLYAGENRHNYEP